MQPLEVKITDLANYTSPDRAVDVLPIVDVGNDQTKKITINNALSLTSAPLGISDIQTVSNKTLDNTTVLAIQDSNLTIESAADNTKTIQFALDNIGSSTNAIFGFPASDSTDTFVLANASQTIAGKTFDSPTIDLATITDAVSISTDLIAGSSSATSGSIFGMSVTGGTIGPTALSTGTIKLGYAQITSNFVLSSSQTTPTQITGLSVSVTIPTGGRSIQVTVYCGALQTATGTAVMGLWDGVVGSGTQVGQANSSADNSTVTLQAILTPSSGSKTYNASVSNSGTNDVTVGAIPVAQPAFILVEAI